LIVNQYGVAYACESPAWLPKSIGSLLDYNDIFDLLNSYEARAIRSEISLNRYSYCNHKICKYLGFNKDSFQHEPSSADDLILLTESEFTNDSQVSTLPKNICFDFDYTCNFKCPSCREDMINHNQGPMWETNKLLVEKIKHLIIDRYTNEYVAIRWAGGEPFVSQAYLDLWEYISATGNTRIRNIIQTNGSYLEKRARLLENFLPYVDMLRISFDAGTADTYAKIRVNGDWAKLLDNCRFVKKLIDASGLTIALRADYVIQSDNYQEIPQFVDTVFDLGFDGIGLTRMWNWGTWPDEEFARLNVTDSAHPKHQELLDILEPYRNDQRIHISV
jgi:molybdenum cofactor biosynthesis enzyme MoaA